ncbi:MAG: carbamoyltransferase HypF [Thermoplasmata archaeon]
MKILVTGIVQGVGFRPQVAKIAKSLGLKGYVKNVGSYVEIYIESGEKLFIERLMQNIPPLARIDSVSIVDEGPSHTYQGFEIIRSTEGYKNYMFPPDTAVCDDCLREMFDPANRRYLYPFTNCVNCGARFSVTYDLPYDRERTSMVEFPMCDECNAEYLDRRSRRYDAQTISCWTCGPKYAIYDENGSVVPTDDPIKYYAHALDEGRIGIAKSWGGMHISVILDRLEDFRRWYRRPMKPFALMVKDLSTAEKYAKLSPTERDLLSSRMRPIVLLEKRDLDDPVLEKVSPGLPNIGLYLPYAGLHHILFHYMKNDAIVNTSANFANEPMIIENGDIFQMGADVYLLHDRKIVNRTDDTVLRTFGNRTFFVRKSRGYVPDVMNVDYKASYLSLGSEMNGRISLSKDGKLFSSQYIGDISYRKTLDFLEENSKRFMKMLDINHLDGVAIDMHPQFSYRRFARSLAEESGIEVTEVQHHHAHAASLLADTSSRRILAMVLDGTGYGSDGNVWGGEILDADFSSFKRIGSLEDIPLPGNEEAIRHPLKVVFGINEMLGGQVEMGYDRDLYGKIIRKSARTSSFGRVLDAVAAYLGVCTEMTYDGEPAMKLEKLLRRGKNRFRMDTVVAHKNDRRVISVLPLFSQLFDLKLESAADRADAAYSFIYALIEKMAEVSTDWADQVGTDIGLTGGVSYNATITALFGHFIGEKRLRLHNSIPNGDGGISVGQNLIVASLSK